MGSAEHWKHVYERREPNQVSWFEASPATSLRWIERTGVAADAAILDAGGGASALAGELARRGYTDITVAEISPGAVERARAALGETAERITWIEADLRTHAFARRYDLWHDRAVFHFMVEAADRDAYMGTMAAAVRPGGHLVLATFGPDGPTECSGLPVRRYGADALAALLADRFLLIDSELTEHRTPSGSTQQFTFALFERLDTGDA